MSMHTRWVDPKPSPHMPGRAACALPQRTPPVHGCQAARRAARSCVNRLQAAHSKEECHRIPYECVCWSHALVVPSNLKMMTNCLCQCTRTAERCGRINFNVDRWKRRAALTCVLGVFQFARMFQTIFVFKCLSSFACGLSRHTHNHADCNQGGH